jgi:hypothetical protein
MFNIRPKTGQFWRSPADFSRRLPKSDSLLAWIIHERSTATAYLTPFQVFTSIADFAVFPYRCIGRFFDKPLS